MFHRYDKLISNGSNNRVILLQCLLMPFILITVSGCQTVTSNTTNDSFSINSQYDASNIAHIRTTLAGQYIKENKLDSAMLQLQSALQADNKYAPAYDMMGVLLQREGSVINLQKSDVAFKKAISLDSSFMQTRNNYGVYLSQMNRYKEASDQFLIASSALGYRGRIAALENLGRTLIKLGDEDLAIETFIKVLDNRSNSLIAHIELVDLLIKKNHIKQARNLYNELLFLMGEQQLSARILRQGVILVSKEIL